MMRRITMLRVLGLVLVATLPVLPPAPIVVEQLVVEQLLPAAEAQTLRGSRTGTTADVSCAGNAGTPTQIAPRRASRVGYVVVNDSAVGVYIGFDTGTTSLTGANALFLPTGQALTDALPGTFIGELRCQSSDVTARTVRVAEVLQ